MDPKTIVRFKERIPGLKVLVVGDLMLDRYLWGRVNRISPEAPVPVVDVEKQENRCGGAANVALNMRAMGAQVALCGIIGDDENGNHLMKRLVVQGFDTKLVLRSAERITTTKTRVIGNNQQILRVDHEERHDINAEICQNLLRGVLARLGEFQAVVFEDYDKGMLTSSLISGILEQALVLKVPTFVDPKFRNFFAYRDCSLFKPNLKELNEALGLRLQKQNLDGIAEAIRELRNRMPHRQTVVTLSDNGAISVDAEGNSFHVHSHIRKITDVSGAGDSVIAILALSIASGFDLFSATKIANLAGGLVCEEVGVVPVDKERLFREMENLH